MCIPPPMLTALSVASSVGSGVAQVVAQSRAAKAQAEAQEQASNDLAAQYAHTNTEQARAQDEANISAALEAAEAQREGDEQISRGTTAAAESGVEGSSVGLALDNLRNEVLEYKVMASLSEKAQVTALGLAQEGASMRFTQDWRRLNPPIEGPDLLGIGMQTLGSALGAYQQGQLYESQRANFSMQNDLYAARRATEVARTQAAIASTGRQAAATRLAEMQTEGQRLRNEGYARSRLLLPGYSPPRN